MMQGTMAACMGLAILGYGALGGTENVSSLVLVWPVVLAMGIAMGIMLTVGAMVIVWYQMTCSQQEGESTTRAEGHDMLAEKEGVGSIGERGHVCYQGPLLPHPVAVHGCFQGIVYTVVESAWNIGECVLDWPPCSADFKVWTAEIQQGTLVLHPMKDSSKTRSASRTDGEPLGIPLSGCTIDIVRDGLQGRSDFLRRAPLLIQHRNHAIMDGERGFYMFANSPASKVCWVTALRYWSAVPRQGYDAGQYREVEEMYSKFCRKMKDSLPLTEYISSQTGVTQRCTNRDVQRSLRWSWKRLGQSQLRTVDEQNISRQEDAQDTFRRIESLIDREWMGSPEKTKTGDRGEQDHQKDSGVDETSTSSHWKQDLPGVCSPDHFLNDLLLRFCFDFVRNSSFSDPIASRIQTQLDRIHTPEYVRSLKVIQVDAGNTCPSISNLTSLPSPVSDYQMPQIAFDMKYEGTFSIVIEVRVDIRDSRSWGTLDKAIDMIEGKPPANPLNEGTEEIDLLRSVSGIHTSDTMHEGEGQASSTRSNLEYLRQGAAQRLRKLADSTASRLASLPLRIKLTFSNLQGPMCAWVLPPPSDRLFWSFLIPPKLSITATPEFGERVFKYAYHASRASAWIEARMKLAFRKNLVFPSGGDIRVPGLLSVETPMTCVDQRQAQSHESSHRTSSAEDEDERFDDDTNKVECRLEDTRGAHTAEQPIDEQQAKPSGSLPRPFFELRFRKHT